MEQTGLAAVCQSAEKKLNFFQSQGRYFVYACMAGCFCSLGMALAYAMGGSFYASEALRGAYKLILGSTFTLSFTMIIFAGAELFTGNVFVFTVSVLSKKTAPAASVQLVAFCYLANILGAAVMGAVVAATGLLQGSMGDLLVTSAMTKMTLPFFQAFFRGVLCNTLVCLGIWCVTKMKSETAKLIVLLWVVLGFAGPGYEHSIANAGIFTMAMLAPQAGGAGLSLAAGLAGALRNLVPVTLGNLVGGGLCVGWVYWFAGSGKITKPEDDLPSL